MTTLKSRNAPTVRRYPRSQLSHLIINPIKPGVNPIKPGINLIEPPDLGAPEQCPERY